MVLRESECSYQFGSGPHYVTDCRCLPDFVVQQLSLSPPEVHLRWPAVTEFVD
jgi:hypothetical protein